MSEQNQNLKREMRAKNNGELLTYEPFKTTAVCTHAGNLALGTTDLQEQQAYTTTFRPREVVEPPMVVARPTLTSRDQTFNYAENELPASVSRAACILKSSPVLSL